MSSPPTHNLVRTARHTPFSPPSTNSHPPYQPYLPCLQPTQLHSRTNSNPTYSTRSSNISTALRTLSHLRHTLPLPTRPTPTPQPNKSIPPYTLHILSYPPNPYMPIPPQRLVSVLAGRGRSLWRFCCALTIEYKWATTRQNVSSTVSDLARHKPACAATQAS